MRIDRHAADWIDRGFRRPRVLVRLMVQGRPLANDTLGGYIAAMRKEAKMSSLKRLRRIEGQVRGLARMVEDERYCIDVVTQISAVRAALRRVEEEILADHVGHCVEHAIASGNKHEQRQKVAELIEVLSRADR
jgi:DNA-binding FrmR family transcriptional regulator